MAKPYHRHAGEGRAGYRRGRPSGMNIVAVDDYDNRDELYQFQEGHLVDAYNILAPSTIPEVIYDFNSDRD